MNTPMNIYTTWINPPHHILTHNDDLISPRSQSPLCWTRPDCGQNFPRHRSSLPRIRNYQKDSQQGSWLGDWLMMYCSHLGSHLTTGRLWRVLDIYTNVAIEMSHLFAIWRSHHKCLKFSIQDRGYFLLIYCDMWSTKEGKDRWRYYIFKVTYVQRTWT